MSAPELRPYQAGSLNAIAEARANGFNRVLEQLPTGTGKTVAFARLLTWPPIKAWLDSLPPTKGAKMLVIAHREELLDQAAEKIRAANAGILVSIEQGDRHANSYSDVIIASIQTLAAMKFRRLKRLLARHTPRVVVIDEAHHSSARTYRTALVHLGFLPPSTTTSDDVETDTEAANFDDVAQMEATLKGWDAIAPQDRLLVGVTATPNRSDAVGLGCVFQTIAFSYPLKQAIDDGWLVPITPWVIETATSLDDVQMARGDFNQRQLADAVNNERRNALAVAGWQEHAAGRSTIAFTVDVAHAHDLATAFEGAGVRARALSGETPKDDRREMLRSFSEGRIDVLANCMVLTEGTDLPRTSCILHAKPTKSATLYEQMSGRGLRLFPDKRDCILIDLVDVARRHSLQVSPVLYGLPPSLMAKGKDLREIAKEIEDLIERYPGFDPAAQGRVTLEQLQARAKTFDVWSVPSLGAFGAGRALNWIKTGEDEYRLQYPWGDGLETLTVEKDMLGHYSLSLTLRPHDGSHARQRSLAAQVTTAEEAASMAEAFVLAERRSVTKLKAMDAPWRKRPASEKQRALLQRMRVPFNAKTLTMGEASNLIDLGKHRQRFG